MAGTRRREVELRNKYAKKIATSTDPLEIIQGHCFTGGITGLKSLTKAFNKADKDGSGTLDYKEFHRILTRTGVTVNEKLVKKAFAALDADKDGVISFQEACLALRPPTAAHRRELIHRAFLKLDRDRSGHVTVEDLSGVYNAKKHPKYLNGEWTEKRVTQEFIKTFDISRDGKISEDEFRDYYLALSASIENDAYFDLVMRQAWGL